MPPRLAMKWIVICLVAQTEPLSVSRPRKNIIFILHVTYLCPQYLTVWQPTCAEITSIVVYDNCDERKYEQSKLTVDKLQSQEQRNKSNSLLNSTKKDYITNKIENAESSKDLYKICDKLLNREQKAILTSHDCAQSLANTCVNYFNEKLNWFETTLKHHWIHQRIKFQTVFPYFVVSPSNNLMLFLKQHWIDIQKIISSSPTKSCALDPIPTWLLKQCQDQLAPVLTTIVNASLSCAEFPTELKKAFLTPLIKKIILDCEIFKNYRPVSNLSFISKLVERLVCVQLIEHLKTNNLYAIFPSAYRQIHSTETALLRVQMTYSKPLTMREEPF